MSRSVHAFIRTNFQYLKEVTDSEAQNYSAIPKPNTLRPVKPLEVQITELMASLPPAQRDRKWSMVELVARLEGRYRDNPHPQMIGEALRRLGWSAVRSYRKADWGRRYWVYKD